MDSHGGECCIARYANGHGGGVYNHNPKIDRIMLKFRPIAPKPASSSSGSGGSSPEKNDSLLKPTRVKRKYVRGSGAVSGRKKRLVSEEQRLNHRETLPLLPEKPDQKRLLSSSYPTVINEPIYFPIWLNSEERMKRSSDLTILTRPQPVRPVGSCVIVECVTDTGMEDEEVLLTLGNSSTDEEKKMSLEKDTCPGFISDGLNRVWWTNEAYRNMVNQDRGHTGPEMVWLVVKDENLPLTTCEAFACRVRVQYTCPKEKSMLTTVPCDVWKMKGGGFAWRLDVKAALSLGR
ncbi:hypothetical protein ACHQM5_010701 [Ranunculus cassubicifolius]